MKSIGILREAHSTDVVLNYPAEPKIVVHSVYTIFPFQVHLLTCPEGSTEQRTQRSSPSLRLLLCFRSLNRFNLSPCFVFSRNHFLSLEACFWASGARYRLEWNDETLHQWNSAL
jgi:hypothetical protein